MFSENLKTLRKAKGLSQEELAIRLNVVRQTISKWEKGLSVPDADLLIRIADIFEVSVSKLLGATFENEENEKDVNLIAEQLSRINEQLATKNRRSRRIWNTIAIIFFAFIALYIIAILLNIANTDILRQGEATKENLQSDPFVVDAPNALLPQIMYEDIIYYFDGNSQFDIEIEPTEDTLKIKLLVPLTQIPKENGQANFGDAGNYYIEYESGLLVYWNNKWVWFVTLEQLIS